MKPMQSYPDIQQETKEKLNKFPKAKVNRHKRETGNLGEFIIKVSLSK